MSDVERILRGPVYCSPFIVAEQDTGPNSPPKLRVCRNLSKNDPLTGTPSVNSYIAKEDFPTRFDMAFRVADESPVNIGYCARSCDLTGSPVSSLLVSTLADSE
ncbi:hypothetical protein D9615_008454 [Tricholomella constricta]|uniref:Uncharacterized protein n=1 Tax=Tricholomella constricta TaxID=117010 RepID=A0A8H5H3T0_9AGAR|nr:hypothetical protein D9615_008454 [Tricholomella constricta]